MGLDIEKELIRNTVDGFLEKLGLSAKYTVRFTKHEQWSVKIREFSGTFGQQLLLNAHLALRTSDRTHNVVVHYG